ncbi:hypothetical protein HanIR_Chr14g0724351 [Helianthus annuus]|nr:hypothetical protein HanIR_Chr14g0724351 [Helianthus annuus]
MICCSWPIQGEDYCYSCCGSRAAWMLIQSIISKSSGFIGSSCCRLRLAQSGGRCRCIILMRIMRVMMMLRGRMLMKTMLQILRIGMQKSLKVKVLETVVQLIEPSN